MKFTGKNDFLAKSLFNIKHMLWLSVDTGEDPGGKKDGHHNHRHHHTHNGRKSRMGKHVHFRHFINWFTVKFSDRQVWANSVDPDQTAPRGAV